MRHLGFHHPNFLPYRAQIIPLAVRLFASISPGRDGWLNAGSGLVGVHYCMIFSNEGPRVEFWLQRSTPAKNKAMFDYLYERRAQLETVFGAPLEWRRLDNKKASIVVCEEKIAGFEREKWPAMVSWLVAHVPKLEKTFGPEIGNLRHLLDTQFPKNND